MEVFGESTAVALEVAQVTPTQLGNVCLRQYLSSRSLGKTSDANNAIKVGIEQTVGQQWNECRWCVYLEFILFLNLVLFDSSSQLKSKKLKHICISANLIHQLGSPSVVAKMLCHRV